MYRVCGWAAVAAISCVLAGFWAAGSAQATVFPASGGTGDFKEEHRCPEGQVLVGFYGRTGLWVDQIGLVCARFQEPSYTVLSRSRPPGRGGNGGGANEQICDPDAAIRKVTIGLLGHRHGLYGGRLDYLGNIKFSCYRPRNGSFAGGRIFGGTAVVEPDLARWAPPTIVTQECPGSEYAVGLSLRYGKHVNAAGLICGAFTATAASAPAETVGSGMENNIDRPGSDYDRFHINDQRPDRCQSECMRQRDRCKAWTYVRPGIQHKYAVCYLKSAVPAAQPNGCCISGVLPNKSPVIIKEPNVPNQGGSSSKSGPFTLPDPSKLSQTARRRCKSGYVWREAGTDDVVCVTPESRTLAKQENAVAASRRDPNGAWGPQTCISGFVWREAFNGDTVCVTPERRTAVKEENRVAPSRTE